MMSTVSTAVCSRTPWLCSSDRTVSSILRTQIILLNPQSGQNEHKEEHNSHFSMLTGADEEKGGERTGVSIKHADFVKKDK